MAGEIKFSNEEEEIDISMLKDAFGNVEEEEMYFAEDSIYRVSAALGKSFIESGEAETITLGSEDEVFIAVPLGAEKIISWQKVIAKINKKFSRRT